MASDEDILKHLDDLVLGDLNIKELIDSGDFNASTFLAEIKRMKSDGLTNDEIITAINASVTQEMRDSGSVNSAVPNGSDVSAFSDAIIRMSDTAQERQNAISGFMNEKRNAEQREQDRLNEYKRTVTEINATNVITDELAGAFKNLVESIVSFLSGSKIVDAIKASLNKMNDKFKANIWLAAPAAIIVLVAYIFIGQGMEVPAYLPEVEWYKVIPYVAVLVMAIVGVNVLIVLFIGILLAGIIGIAAGSFDAIGWMGAMGNGIMGMSELIIVTLLAGGMLALIRYNGGIEYLIRALTKRIRGKRGAKFTIALLVILADMCTANNTIALVTVGPMAKEIADKYGIDKRISASLLDTFSCFTQGFLPYGAQLLMAAGLAHITPFEITAYLYYPMALGLIAMLGIIFDYPRKFRV